MIKDSDPKWIDLYNTIKNACIALEKMLTPLEKGSTLSPEFEGVQDKEIIEVWNSDKKPEWPHIERFRSASGTAICTYNDSGSKGLNYRQGSRIKPALLGFTARVSESYPDFVNVYDETGIITTMPRILFDKIFKTTIKEGKSIEI